MSGRAFVRGDGEALTVTTGSGEAEHAIAMDGIGSVSALRGDSSELLMTASRAGDPEPKPTAGERGKLRLFRARLGDSEWQELYRGYAHDPVRLPDGYAVHRGAGITVLAEDGRVVHETKVGRFNWGPPSLSVSPAGDRIAWTRWKGDDQKLTVQRPLDEKPHTFPQSCHCYAWVDDTTLVYYLGGPLRLLDVETGKTRQLLELEHADASHFHVQVVGDRIWFAVLVPKRLLGREVTLRHVGLDGKDEEVVFKAARDELLRSFVAFPDGSAWIRMERFRRMTIVERPVRTIGPLAEFLEAWQPLLTSASRSSASTPFPEVSLQSRLGGRPVRRFSCL